MNRLEFLKALGLLPVLAVVPAPAPAVAENGITLAPGRMRNKYERRRDAAVELYNTGAISAQEMYDFFRQA